jgi:transcriptional regulator with XRE-family HTH domain
MLKAFRGKLGERIQKLRKEKGITQEELASMTSLDRVSIGYIEQGIRAPKLRTLLAIAKALKIEVKELFSF